MRGVVPTRVGTATERTESPPSSDDGYRSVWRVTLFDEMRDEQAAAVLREVNRARALLPSDPVRARRLFDGSENVGSELAQVLFILVRAEIGGVLDDVVAVEINLSSTLKHVMCFPSGFRVQVADAVLSIGECFGVYDAAAAAMAESLVVRRGLADSPGIPESLHDLVISLGNLAGVVERLGDAERAESLRAERDRIAEILGNRSSET